MSIKVYLAAMYSEKEEINNQAEIFRQAGIKVTSTWLNEQHHPTIKMSEVSDEFLTNYANNDLSDIDDADWLVFHSVEPTTPTVRGGRHVEFGYALALSKLILVVGPKENIFHHLPQVKHVDDWGQALKFLLNQKENRYVNQGCHN